VEEPRSHVILEDTWIKANMDYITNLGEPINVFEGQLLHSTRSQTPLYLKNLLFSPHLPTRKTHEKEPLIDYNQSHVVTFDEYLQILHKKAMDKEVTKIIKEQKKKGKGKNKAKTCNKFTYCYKHNN
jgi:hypothetical protein